MGEQALQTKTDVPWAKLTLRYQGSGWWLDRLMPHRPLIFIAVAVGLPIAWFFVGLAVTPDQAAYVKTPDVVAQLAFFPLHLFSVRFVANLWAAGLPPSLDGLALGTRAQLNVKRGALGTLASLGALVVVLPNIGRDIWFALTPDPRNGKIPFDDADQWDMAALGRPVHYMMLSLWVLEWLLNGYLLWIQLWTLIGWTREVGRQDFQPHLEKVLIGDGYRHAFQLFAKTTSICLVFAFGNLAFIYATGELFPHESTEIADAQDFMENMSDMLAMAMLFVLALLAISRFVTVLRRQLTKAVNAEFVKAGDAAIEDLVNPIVPTGDTPTDLARLQQRVTAQAGILRAVVFQTEVSNMGGGPIISLVAKAAIPLVTTGAKIAKLKIKSATGAGG